MRGPIPSAMLRVATSSARKNDAIVAKHRYQRACFSSSSTSALRVGKTPQRIVFGSCSDQNEDLSYWDTFVALKPDLTLLMGDNVYGGRSIDTLTNAYNVMCANPSFQRAKQANLKIIPALDDNDYGNGGDATRANPNKEAAKEAFLEFWQVPKEDHRWKHNRGVHTSIDWGEELQIIVLDLRYWRSPFVPTDSPGAPGKQHHIPDTSDRTKTMLGNMQWQWLEKELQKPARLRLIVSPLQVFSQAHGFECWNMLPFERERFIAAVEQSQGPARQSKALILSGDRHASALYRLPRVDGMDPLEEVTSSSLTHSVPDGLLDNEVDELRVGNFVTVNNFGMLDINWLSSSAELSFVEASTGKIIFSHCLRVPAIS